MIHQLVLDYDLAEGWLAPWVDGLRKGRAVASHCTTCNMSHFPPLRTCPECRARSDGWVTLPGRAEVLWRTSGADGDFVMARFDGVQCAAILRAGHLPEGATRGQLSACADGDPILKLEAEPTT